MNSDDKKRYRSLRRQWGLICLVAWVAGWYGAKNFWGALFALFTFPFPLIVGHYFGKYRWGQESAAAQQRVEQTTRANAKAVADAEAQHRAQRTASVEQADMQLRHASVRKEVINKLGVISDYLDLMPMPPTGDRAMMIMQDLKKELRELIAKYPLSSLVELIRADESVQLQLEALQPRLVASGMNGEGYAILLEAYRRAMGLPMAPPLCSAPAERAWSHEAANEVPQPPPPLRTYF